MLALLMAGMSSHAARFTGAYLLHLCEVDERGREKVKGGHTACQSYIAGVLDYHSALQSLKIAPKINICIPQSVKMADLHETVLHYLRVHGEHDGFIAAPAVTMGLYQRYPCR